MTVRRWLVLAIGALLLLVVVVCGWRLCSYFDQGLHSLAVSNHTDRKVLVRFETTDGAYRASESFAPHEHRRFEFRVVGEASLSVELFIDGMSVERVEHGYMEPSGPGLAIEVDIGPGGLDVVSK